MHFPNKGPIYDYTLVASDIVYGIVRKGAEPTIDNQRLQVEELVKLTGGPFYAIGDITEIRAMTKPERDFSKSDTVKENIRAMAFIVGSPLAKIIGNLYMGLTGSSVPTEVFTSYEDALAWIQRRKALDEQNS